MRLPGARKYRAAKSGDFDVDDNHLLMVTTDRLSAFDVVMPDPIPDKGAVLNRISLWWFDRMKAVVRNHVVSSDINKYPAPFKGDVRLKDRSMLVIKAKPLAIECIVRGLYIGLGLEGIQGKGLHLRDKTPIFIKGIRKTSRTYFHPFDQGGNGPA